MSVANWGEKGTGNWTLEVFAFDTEGTKTRLDLLDWSLRTFGESIDPAKSRDL